MKNDNIVQNQGDEMMKSKALITLLWCCAFLYCLTQPASSTQELDFEMIVAGLKNYDKLIQSGEADVTFRTSQYDKQDRQIDSMVSERHIIFDRDRILLKSEESIAKQIVGRNIVFYRQAHLAKKSGVLTVHHHPGRGNGTSYMFQSFPHPYVMESDPRHLTRGMWGGALSDYVVKKNFSIKSSEIYDDVLCYVLEYRGVGRIERIWISPERGVSYLKCEKWSMARAIPSRGFEKKAPEVSRQRISYQKNGGAWFPKKWQYETSWIDDEGKEHPRIKQELEVKNLRLNYKISDDTFTIEIPDGAKIWSADLNKNLSKEEFYKLYGSAFNEE